MHYPYLLNILFVLPDPLSTILRFHMTWVGKIPWRRERLPTPVFWSGEFHGLYSPEGCRVNTTEWLSLSLSFHLPLLPVVANINTLLYFVDNLICIFEISSIIWLSSIILFHGHSFSEKLYFSFSSFFFFISWRLITLQHFELYYWNYRRQPVLC